MLQNKYIIIVISDEFYCRIKAVYQLKQVLNE